MARMREALLLEMVAATAEEPDSIQIPYQVGGLAKAVVARVDITAHLAQAVMVDWVLAELRQRDTAATTAQGAAEVADVAEVATTAAEAAAV